MSENWSLIVHLVHGKRPQLVADEVGHLDFNPNMADSLKNPVTIFTYDPAHKAWAVAISKASAAFWEQHDVMVVEIKREETEANGQFGVVV